MKNSILNKKSIFSFLIDFLISIITIMLVTYLIGDMISSKIVYYIFLIIIFILSFITSDFRFNNKSIGKKIMKLSLKFENEKEINSVSILILRNLIDLLLFPISLIYLIYKGKTIGDIIFKTKLVTDESNVINNEYKYTFFDIIFRIVPLAFLLIICIFFQKINYQSIRFILAIIIYVIILFIILLHDLILKRKIKIIKKNYEFCNIIIFIIIYGGILQHIPIDYMFFKFEPIDNFKYTFPNKEVLYQYEENNVYFIYYNSLFRTNTFVYDEKLYKIHTPFEENQTQNIINKNYVMNYFCYQYFIGTQHYSKYTVVVKTKDKSLDIQSDSLNLLDVINKKGYYYHIFISNDEKEENTKNLTITIQDKKYNLYKLWQKKKKKDALF